VALTQAPARHTTGSLLATDGTRLHLEQWLPAAPAVGTIVLVHGHGEHLGRYGHLITALTTEQYAVVGAELRGHGHSGGRRGHVDRWHRFADDLDLTIDHAAEATKAPQAFLFGHSLGGLIALDYLLQRPRGISGAVISAPPLLPHVGSRRLELFGRLLSPVVPKFSVQLGISAPDLTHDPADRERIVHDPLAHRRISARLATEARRAIARVNRDADRLVLPLLLIHGAADPLALPEGSRAFIERTTFPDRDLRLYPGGLHELHNDTMREEVFADICSWLRRHRPHEGPPPR